jgi:small-conductance mechanosensitive channel
MSTQFDTLLGDLQKLTKAMPAEDEEADEKIQAAGGDETEGEDEGAEDEPPAKKGKKKPPFMKSMTVTLEDGTEVEAEDGTELVKSLTESLGALSTHIDESDTMLAKTIGETVTLLKAQGAAIAAMQTQLKAIAGEGRGRKAVVNLVEKPAAAGGAAGEGLNPDLFMAKAISKMGEGRLAGNEVAFIEASFNRGDFRLPAALIAKVEAA